MLSTESVPPTMTPDEAARYLSLSRSGIYAAIRDGVIPSVRVGSRLVVSRDFVERMLEPLGIEQASDVSSSASHPDS
jgi:excisionase family DNA binding protein